jgi:hypothetical protein
VIAVNPSHIEMYESLLFFKRLTQNVVENYDFVNGAPAVGATLDLSTAPEIFRNTIRPNHPSEICMPFSPRSSCPTSSCHHAVSIPPTTRC